MPVGRHRARTGLDDAANNVDQRGLAGAVGAEKRKDFAASDVQIDRFECVKTGRVGFSEFLNGNNRLHVCFQG